MDVNVPRGRASELVRGIGDELTRLDKDCDRLREYICTLYVNALRSTPETQAEFIAFISHSARSVNGGATLSDAMKAWYERDSGSEAKPENAERSGAVEPEGSQSGGEAASPNPHSGDHHE